MLDIVYCAMQVKEKFSEENRWKITMDGFAKRLDVFRGIVVFALDAIMDQVRDVKNADESWIEKFSL